MDPFAHRRNDQIFPKPPDPDRAILWRYLSTEPAFSSINKFEALFKSGRLWLTKASTFPDTFEGVLPDHSRLDMEYWAKVTMRDGPDRVAQIEEAKRQMMYVNCWHLGMVESPFMWREYCGSKEGVLIRTTFSKLALACEREGEEKFPLGLIRYIDRSEYRVPLGNAFYPFMHKDLKFEPECEARIITIGDPTVDHAEMKVDIESLIDKIIVHPNASEEYFAYVQRVVEEEAPLLKDSVKWSEIKNTTPTEVACIFE